MFTWICPKCGREVGPSYSECPFCADVAAKSAPPAPQPPAPNYPPQGYPPAQHPGQAQPPVQPYPPQQYPPPQYPSQQYPPQAYPAQQYPPQQYPPPQYAHPTQQPPQATPPPQALYNYPPQQAASQHAALPPVAAPAPVPFNSLPVPEPLPPPQKVYYVGEVDNKSALPPWAAAVLAFVLIAGLVSALVWYTRSNRNAATAQKKTEHTGDHPFKKSLELTGFRISEAAGKKLQVQFLAINHGSTDMGELAGVVTLRARGAESDAPACTFKFRISGIPAFGAKEISVTEFTQKRKFFEMPDWQYFEPLVEITSAP